MIFIALFVGVVIGWIGSSLCSSRKIDELEERMELLKRLNTGKG